MGYKARIAKVLLQIRSFNVIFTIFVLQYQDADATLTSPMLLGVCDGVSQLEELAQLGFVFFFNLGFLWISQAA